jgi:hypothetical protein
MRSRLTRVHQAARGSSGLARSRHLAGSSSIHLLLGAPQEVLESALARRPHHTITATKAIMSAGDAFANRLAHGGEGGCAVAGGVDLGGDSCHVPQVESSPRRSLLALDVELTTAHCSGVPVPPPLSTVVKPAASSIGFARLLRPPDRQNNTKGLLLSAGSSSSGILCGAALKSHSMEPAGGGVAFFSPDERRSTRTPLDASATRISDGLASILVQLQRPQVAQSATCAPVADGGDYHENRVHSFTHTLDISSHHTRSHWRTHTSMHTR